MSARRRIVLTLVVGNLVVLAVLALTTYDLASSRRLVSDDLLDACLRESSVGAYAVRWRDVEVTGPRSVRAAFADGVVECEVAAPLRPWGPVAFSWTALAR